MWTVKVSQDFSAAHFVPGSAERCERVHGHNYRVEVTVGAEVLKPPGIVVDFVELRAALNQLLPDHRFLNEVYDFPPTAENLARHFYEELRKRYPVIKVTVWENADCGAEYFSERC